MKAALIALALLVTPASADTFIFSYTFSSENVGTTVSGSFDGIANGNIISNISNFVARDTPDHVFINGAFIQRWAGLPDRWVSGGAYLSFDGTENNFRFSQSVSGINEFFSITGTASSMPWAPPEICYGDQLYPINGYWGLGDFPPNSSWTVSAIPEPATWALLLFGFAFFGIKNIWPGTSHE